MLKLPVLDFYENGHNPWYREGVFLEPGKGNNGFSIPERPERTSLRATPMKVGTLDELKVGSNVAFQDFNEHGEWKEWSGLEFALLCLDYEVPVYVVDNHNHVFYCWMEAMEMEWISMGGTLVHMDAHFDDRAPAASDLLIKLGGLLRRPTLNSPQLLAMTTTYTNEVLQIATYIRPAVELGFFERVVNFVESKHFESGYPGFGEMNRMGEGSVGDVVLNIDLDVFCEEMGHVLFDKKMAVLKGYMSRTALITFATSPSFIDQNLAISMCKKVVKGLFG